MDELTQKFFETLLRTQFLPPDRMLAYQRGLLEKLVRHARAQVPFYRDSGRLDVLFRADDTIDWNRWADVPILTRMEVQENNERLYAETTPPDCGHTMSGRTTGSTGRPLFFRFSTIMAAANSALLERAYVWADLPSSKVQAWLVSLSPGEAEYPMGTLYKTRIRDTDREVHQLNLSTPLERQREWLARLRPEVISSYPGVLASLGERLPRGLEKHRFQLAICLGEVLVPETRAAIERSFRCPVMDVYSGSEFGIIATEHVGTGRMFIAEETAFVELERNTESARSHPDLAELVTTPFYNYAMPLIRYTTGDLAELDRGASPDDRTLRRLIRIAGRARHFFILPSGRHWWPQVIKTKQISEYLSFNQIQFAQTERGRIELRFVSRTAEPLRNEAGLIADLRASVPEPVEFVVRQVPAIARHRSGKYIDYVCEIEGANRD